MLRLINFVVVPILGDFMLRPYLVVKLLVCVFLRFYNNLAEEERAGLFTSFVFLLSSGCNICSVSLPHGVVGWSVVCDCCISW